MPMWLYILCMRIFCFNQKTVCELRSSDWSSDVCSSDLDLSRSRQDPQRQARAHQRLRRTEENDAAATDRGRGTHGRQDRKSVVSGKSVSERVDLGGRRIIK